MKNEALYHKTVHILVQAYFNDTLEHGNCYACAVGNMIAGNCGLKLLDKRSEYNASVWTGIGYLYWDKKNKIEHNPVMLFDHGLYEKIENDEQEYSVKSTGYSLAELAKIEWAFEKVCYTDCGVVVYSNSDELMFNGLMAVIDALDEIHENNSSEVSETSKRKFSKQLIPQS
jgi:hypothetical protein